MIICQPIPNYGRAVRWCPTCQRRRRQLVLVEYWHGELSVCQACRVAVDDAGGNRSEMPHDFDEAWAGAPPLSQVRRDVERRNR